MILLTNLKLQKMSTQKDPRQGKRFAMTIKPQKEKNSGKSKTIPNQVMSVREVAERFIRGQSVPQKEAMYQEAMDYAVGLDTFEAIDKARKEMAVLQQQFKEMHEKSKWFLEQKKAAAAEKPKRQRREKIEAAMEEKLAKELGV